MRHGESTSDIEDRYGGDYDDHLTEKGRNQAQEAAEKLSGKGIEIMFSSSKLRAKETAEIIQENLGCKLKIVDDIRERNRYGILTGMIKEEAKEKYPEQVKLLESQLNNAEGGEPYEHFKERVIKGFNNITNLDHNIVGVVSHGGPSLCLFREIIGGAEKIDHLADCAIIELQKEGKYLKLLKTDGVFLK